MPPSRHRRRRAARRSQRRTPPISSGGGFRSRWLLFAFGAIAVLFIIALLVPVVLPVNFGGGGSRQGEASGYVEGIGTQVDAPEDRAHFADSFTIYDVSNQEGYSTTPPTSGRHWDGWVQCGWYTEAVPDERIVHNMEHGNIILSYNLTDQAQIDELKDAYESIGLANRWGVARPYNPAPDAEGNDRFPEGTIALTTWGVIDKWHVDDLDADGDAIGVGKDRTEEFFRAYSGTLSPEFPAIEGRPAGADCTRGGVMNP